MPLKVGLCATESSGDILGSDLIRNLKSKDPLIEFYGLGGSEMRKEGFNSFDSNTISMHFGLSGYFLYPENFAMCVLNLACKSRRLIPT